MGDINVLGTSFNVRDYPDEHSVTITLEEGVIKYNSTNKDKKPVTLESGFQITDSKNNREININHVNTSLFTSWKDGNYIFENASLEEIMKILGKWYNVTFIYDSQEIKQIRYTGILKRYTNISRTLDFLESCEDVLFQLSGKTVIIKKANS
jgi:ferric-dicitrate binding protein FerR (iron transport regulator)